MSFLDGVIKNKAVAVPVIAWFVAQSIKVIGLIIKDKKIDFTRFVGSGGMPSSHSAFVVSLSTVIGINYGWDTGIFGMSVAIALIVMYDAAGIRRAAGKQAEVLNKIIYSHPDKHQFENLKELLGHTPVEVIMGAAVGIIIGLLMG